MRVAIYARVSTDDKGQNPETQLIPLREYCQRSGYEVHKEYVDQARAKDYKHRTTWAELQKDARQHRFDAVIVWKLDRAFRSTKECHNQLSEWDERGIKFKSYTQDVIDTTTSMGRFVLAIMAAAAELESSLISDRVTAGMTRARQAGKRLGRTPLSVKKGISSQSIYELLKSGMSIKATAKQLGCSPAYVCKIVPHPSKVAKGEL